MTSGDIVAHACLIHCSSKVLGGGLGFPRRGLSIGPLNIHSSNSSASFALNGSRTRQLVVIYCYIILESQPCQSCVWFLQRP